MICQTCNKELEGKRKKYCSKKCQDRATYKKNTVQIKAQVRKWEKENPERTKELHKKALVKFRATKHDRFNELMRKQYHNHKDKWRSRNNVRKSLERVRVPILIDRFCKTCGTTENISMKYEVYPIKIKDIRAAILAKQIYYVCRTCRNKR
jgi:hypothetical protein